MTTLTLYPTQSKVFLSESQDIEWFAGFGAGKTYAALVKLLRYADSNSNSTSAYLTPNGMCTDYVFRNLDIFKVFGEFNVTNKYFEFSNGSRIYFSTTDALFDNRFIGFKIDALVVDNMSEETYRTISCRLDGYKQRIIPRLPKGGFILTCVSSNLDRIIETTYTNSHNPFLK